MSSSDTTVTQANKQVKIEANFKETKEVLLFFFMLGKAIEKSLANDGKITIVDAPNFFQLFLSIGPALQNIESAPLEIKGAGKEELEELKNFVKEEFDLSDDKLEDVVKEAFGLAADLYRFFSTYVFKAKSSELKEETEETKEIIREGNDASEDSLLNIDDSYEVVDDNEEE